MHAGFKSLYPKCAPWEILSGTLASLPAHWTQVFIEGADHGLDLLKRSGRSRADVLSDFAAEVRRWLANLVPLPAR